MRLSSRLKDAAKRGFKHASHNNSYYNPAFGLASSVAFLVASSAAFSVASSVAPSFASSRLFP